MPHVDRHTTHYESCGCAEAEIERLAHGRDCAREAFETANLALANALARIRELEAALKAIRESVDNHGDYPSWEMSVHIRNIIAAALKGGDDG